MSHLIEHALPYRAGFTCRTTQGNPKCAAPKMIYQLIFLQSSESQIMRSDEITDIIYDSTYTKGDQILTRPINTFD